MNANILLTIGLTAVLLIGGFAAVGAASPADAVNNTHANETPSDHADNQSDASDSDTENDGPPSSVGPADAAEEENTSVGPSDGLPEQAPSHVSDIHDTITSFLNGSVDNLGTSLSELLSSADESANESNSVADTGEDASGTS